MIECVDLGLIDYQKAFGIQEELRSKRQRGEIADTVLLLEHPPVFTLGKRDCPQDIVSSAETIAQDGIEMVKTNRGGRVTYHGPGQLVGYFICNLRRIKSMPDTKSPSGVRYRYYTTLEEKGGGVKNFVHFIEELCLGVLSDYGIKGSRDSEHPGIWVGQDKIAAIGLHVHRDITQHGFALNVSCDLSHYRHIIPCGIKGRGVTSLETLLGYAPAMADVKDKLKKHIKRIYSL